LQSLITRSFKDTDNYGFGSTVGLRLEVSTLLWDLGTVIIIPSVILILVEAVKYDVN